MQHVLAGAAVLGSLATASAARADDCVEFDEDPYGPQGTDYEFMHASGGFFNFYGENGGTLYLEQYPEILGTNPFCGSECLHLIGSGNDYHTVFFDFDGNGALPEEVSMTVFAHAGDITFDAYGAGDVWLDRQVADHGETSYIDFDESAGIEYVTMTGGSNEDWIDHVCMDD